MLIELIMRIHNRKIRFTLKDKRICYHQQSLKVARICTYTNKKHDGEESKNRKTRKKK